MVDTLSGGFCDKYFLNFSGQKLYIVCINFYEFYFVEAQIYMKIVIFMFSFLCYVVWVERKFGSWLGGESRVVLWFSCLGVLASPLKWFLCFIWWIKFHPVGYAKLPLLLSLCIPHADVVFGLIIYSLFIEQQIILVILL